MRDLRDIEIVFIWSVLLLILAGILLYSVFYSLAVAIFVMLCSLFVSSIPFIACILPFVLVYFIETNGPVEFAVFLYILFLQCTDVCNFIALAVEYWLWILPGLVVYIAIGLQVSKMKLYVHIRKQNELRKFKEASNNPQKSGSFVSTYVYQNQRKIARWLLFWPFVLCHMFYSEFMVLLADVLYTRFQQHYVELVDSLMRSLREGPPQYAS
jgi:hypothetical protein